MHSFRIFPGNSSGYSLLVIYLYGLCYNYGCVHALSYSLKYLWTNTTTSHWLWDIKGSGTRNTSNSLKFISLREDVGIFNSLNDGNWKVLLVNTEETFWLYKDTLSRSETAMVSYKYRVEVKHYDPKTHTHTHTHTPSPLSFSPSLPVYICISVSFPSKLY